ncbi:hypothetical protein FRB99_008858 [Tulasnella sp. 403]|nr:hypothetical protein FRB99_008858 [Tulasnella sp. 403]
MNSDLIDEDEPVRPPPLSPPLHNTSSPRDQEPLDTQLEELRKWQQERLERRLRGEYESQVRKLTEVVGGNLNQPARIASVRIEGAHHTRTSFLGSLIRPHFTTLSDGISAKPAPVTSLGDALQTTRHIHSLLQDTQIFKSVETTLDRSWSPFAEPNDLDVVFRCKERGKYFLRTATDIGNQEGSANATARVQNAFGGAETVEGNISFGTKTRHAFHLRLEAPLVSFDNSLRTRGEITAFSSQKDNTTFASSIEDLKGVKVALKTPFAGGTNEFAYQVASRHVGHLTEMASLSIREAAGHSIKSALTHTYLRDTRDDTMSATRGSYYRLYNELAGLGGDASHVKTESAFQTSRQIINGLSVSFASTFGLLYPLSLPTCTPKSSSTFFSDRCQLGGPLSVRMFGQNGLGPKDGADSLGGDLYWSTGLSVISNIPKKPHWPVKLHAFVNAGRLDAFDRSKPIDLVESVRQSLARPSISAGIGLIYRFDPVRVEVNFGVPLVASKSDFSKRGFQVGMGLEFL